MRILIYSPNFSPELTGIGKYNGEMADWFQKKGHVVHVITGLPYYPEWKIKEGYSGFIKENANGLKIYRAPLYVPRKNNINLISRVKLQTSFTITSLKYWIPKFFSNEKYDIVIAICPPLQTAIYPYIYSLIRRKPFIIHVQDLEFDAAIRLGFIKSNILAKTLNLIEKTILSRAKLVTTITETMENRINKKGISLNNTWLFPNWSDINFIRPLPRNNKFRKQLALPEDTIIFMYSGNMGEKQGLEIVLEAANILKQKKNIFFVLIGEGVALQSLKEIKKNLNLTNVIFKPLQPYEELPDVLAAGDVHLVIQKSEAADLVMPSKLTNILAAGRPQIATADKDTALFDVINNHGTGLTIVPGEVNQLVEVIEKLANNQGLRQRFGNNSRIYAEKYLDKHQIIGKFERKLEEIVKL